MLFDNNCILYFKIRYVKQILPEIRKDKVIKFMKLVEWFSRRKGIDAFNGVMYITQVECEFLRRVFGKYEREETGDL